MKKCKQKIRVVFVLFTFVWVSSNIRARDADLSPAPLMASVPRQAALVLYTPGLEQLNAAWESLASLGQTDDGFAGLLASPFERLGRRSLRPWIERFDLRLGDLARALPGEVVIGWPPQQSSTGARVRSENWVLLARRFPDRDAAVRDLWHRIAARTVGVDRIERHAVGRAAVEQIAWSEDADSRLAPQGRARVPGRPSGSRPQPADAAVFPEIRKTAQQAFSLGLSEYYVFFTPARAESLEPWIRAAVEGLGAAGRNEPFDALAQKAAGAGDVLLALRTTPPAWVRASEGGTERRFGPNPLQVLLSQTRSLNAVLARRDNQLVVDVQAAVLPPPGWAARLLAPLRSGAAAANTDACRSELTLRADFSELWKALRSVLMEGWPTVAAALDLFFAPLGGEQGEGITRLVSTLGEEVSLQVFRAEKVGPSSRRSSRRSDEADSSHTSTRPPPYVGGYGEGLWAVLVETRDPERFAMFEPRIAAFMATFGQAPLHYAINDKGPMATGVKTAPTSASEFLPRLHVAQTNGRYIVAGSKAALDLAARRLAAKPNGPQPQAVSSNEAAGPQRAPSISLYHEVGGGGDGFWTLGGNARRLIQTPEGTIELISPPKPGAGGKAPTAPPTAALSAALTVESENSVRLQLILQHLTASPSTPGKPVFSKTQKRPRVEE